MKNKVLKLLHFFTPVCVFLSTFILLTIKVNAVGTWITPPPFPVGIPANVGNLDVDLDYTVIETVRDTYLNLLLNSYNNDVSGSYIILVGYDEPNNVPTYHFVCFNNPSMTCIPLDSTGELTYYNNGQHYVDIDYIPSTGSFGSPQFYGGWVNHWTVLYSDTLYNGELWVVDMAQNNLELSNNSNIVFWSKTIDNPNFEVVPPDDIPDYSPDPYGPPSKPQWDPNKTIIENLFDIVVWIGDVILYGFQYVGKLIIGFLQNLIDNLKNFLKNIYDNLVSLIKPFFDKVIDILTNPLEILKGLFIPDPEDFADVIEDNDSFGFIGLFNALRASINGIFYQIHNLTPVYYFHVPSLIFHGQEIGDFDIDFTWFLPYKQYTDGIISAFLTIGWVYWLFVQAAGLLRGNTDPKDFRPSDVSRPN